MDMRFEATPATADVEVLRVVVRVVKAFIAKATALIEQVASISCPSLGSIAANAPNLILEGRQAVAVI